MPNQIDTDSTPEQTTTPEMAPVAAPVPAPAAPAAEKKPARPAPRVTQSALYLREYLERNGWSLAAFGREVGCTKGNIFNLITGKNLPSLQLAMKIEAATGGEVRLGEWT